MAVSDVALRIVRTVLSTDLIHGKFTTTIELGTCSRNYCRLLMTASRQALFCILRSFLQKFSVPVGNSSGRYKLLSIFSWRNLGAKLDVPTNCYNNIVRFEMKTHLLFSPLSKRALAKDENQEKIRLSR